LLGSPVSGSKPLSLKNLSLPPLGKNPGASPILLAAFISSKPSAKSKLVSSK